MRIAARIEPCSAKWTDGLTLEILADAQLRAAGAAQNCLLVELGATPNPRRVISFRLMAKETGIIAPATCELDRHDIKRASVVSAART
jgi:hypothetical protein